MKNNIPKIGDIIYLDTQLHLSHGIDDLRGGRARVISVNKEHGSYWITTEVDPSSSYKWSYLNEEQDRLKKEFGLKWAHSDPDYRSELN